MTPPRSLSRKVYWHSPTPRRSTLFVSTPFSHAAAPGPQTKNCPMCEMSKTPSEPRTAWCSSRMLVYCTGIDQPPKSTMRAPRATCSACSGVWRSGMEDSADTREEGKGWSGRVNAGEEGKRTGRQSRQSDNQKTRTWSSRGASSDCPMVRLSDCLPPVHDLSRKPQNRHRRLRRRRLLLRRNARAGRLRRALSHAVGSRRGAARRAHDPQPGRGLEDRRAGLRDAARKSARAISSSSR